MHPRDFLIPGIHIHLSRLYRSTPVPRPFGRYEIRFIRFIPLFRLLRLLLPYRLDHRKRSLDPIGHALPRLFHPSRKYYARIPDFIPIHPFPSVQSRLCSAGFVKSDKSSLDLCFWHHIPPVLCLAGFTYCGGNGGSIPPPPMGSV